MTIPITEWEFAADVASHINTLISAQPTALPFTRAKVEKRSAGSLKRRDLTLLGSDGGVLLTGEIKMPWAEDGHSPFVEKVIRDARAKARRAGANWFFTWNVNELVLWRRGDQEGQEYEQEFKRYQVATISRPADFDDPYCERGLREGLANFLFDFARLILGTERLRLRPPDDYFIESLESFLERPIELTLSEIRRRYHDPKQRELIERWMRDEQGWTLGGDESDLLSRAAKFSTYNVVNRLIFYEALRKRFPTLPKLQIPPHLTRGEEVLDHLVTFFAKAVDASRDYETVFGDSRADLGSRIPFYAPEIAESWRKLVEHIDRFDFSRLDYDVIGRIFERLIAPEERHKYGQYYTRPEVVDLINSFCIRYGSDTVLDPACGGGTFLVRAYARKRNLAPQFDHGTLLTGLYGVDISHFATHLTTINLAARDLVNAQNYPRIVRADFFDLAPQGEFMRLPQAVAHTRGLDLAETPVILPEVDAVVANPPYLRQEDIRRAKGAADGNGPPPGTKNHYRALVQKEADFKPSGRSDLHVYFWGHATAFLKRNGYLGFLTSSQWLDVEYGFHLQDWILNNFCILAILESRVEPWFVGARVATAVTILRRETDAYRRDENIVRFVDLRAPLDAFLHGDGTSIGMIEAADRFRDSLLAIKNDYATPEFRARLVCQRDLRKQGIEVGGLATAREPSDSRMASEDEAEGPSSRTGLYFGGK